jgi:RluA family pseudouridine synthase
MDILYEDADFLAVNKPAGLATIPGRTDPASVIGELSRQLAERDRTEPPRLLVVHRLDQDTGGILLVAKHTDAQRNLSGQFGKRQVQKTYLAIIAGTPEPPEGDIRVALEADPGRPGAMKPTRRRTAKQAHSAYKVLEEFRGLSLVEVRPTTGRSHQIRVHFKAIGYPLAVDPLYGSSRGVFLSDFKHGFNLKKGDVEQPLIGRLTLHALKLKFKRPSDGTELELEAPLPKDFRGALQALRKYAKPRRRRGVPTLAGTAAVPAPPVGVPVLPDLSAAEEADEPPPGSDSAADPPDEHEV